MRAGGSGGGISMVNVDDSIGSWKFRPQTHVCGFNTDMKGQVSEDHASNFSVPERHIHGKQDCGGFNPA